MKNNTVLSFVLPGMAYWYYTNVNMLVCLDATNKTYLENDN